MKEPERPEAWRREAKGWLIVFGLLAIAIPAVAAYRLHQQSNQPSAAAEGPQATPSLDPVLYYPDGTPRISIPKEWQYSAIPDKLRGGDAQYADLASVNSVSLTQPDETHLYLQLARADGEGTSVGFYFDPSGDFGCSGVCELPMSIDGQRATIRGYSRGTADPLSEWFHVYDGEGLVEALRTGKRLIIEVQIDGYGTQQFEFQTGGLAWPATSSVSSGTASEATADDGTRRMQARVAGLGYQTGYREADFAKCSAQDSLSSKVWAYYICDDQPLADCPFAASTSCTVQANFVNNALGEISFGYETANIDDDALKNVLGRRLGFAKVEHKQIDKLGMSSWTERWKDGRISVSLMRVKGINIRGEPYDRVRVIFADTSITDPLKDR